MLRHVGIAALLWSACAGAAGARPDMLQFNGVIQPDLKTCVSTLRAACEAQFERCSTDNATVFHADETFNVSMICTAFSTIDGAVFSVAASAETGHGKALQEILVKMKEFIDSQF